MTNQRDRKNSNDQILPDLELIISSFKTPFWIEYKKWFVICQSKSYPYSFSISLYSIPVCTSWMTYISALNTISLSNYSKDRSIMDNVSSLNIIFNQPAHGDIYEEEVCYSNKGSKNNVI